jgi:hypothetical protein
VVRPPAEDRPREGASAGEDLGLLAFLFGLHAIPIVALLAGRDWGDVAVGYATVVVLLTGRELLLEASAYVRQRSRSCSR